MGIGLWGEEDYGLAAGGEWFLSTFAQAAMLPLRFASTNLYWLFSLFFFDFSLFFLSNGLGKRVLGWDLSCTANSKRWQLRKRQAVQRAQEAKNNIHVLPQVQLHWG